MTVYGQHHDLMVSERTPRGFSVAARDEASDAAFSWRIVAKRKDIAGERLAAVTVPSEPSCLLSRRRWPRLALECGAALVPIDPEFAAVADLRDNHVFVTPYDDHDLRVSDVTPTGFEVRAKDTTASGRFSWRLVAKRKDIPGERLARVTVPPEPTLPSLPAM